ncbi:molybdopterin cofactor-binding domain-containing protein [Paraflavitalea speifideaquila]|uniref:molybdopterin cofactor-binding domain-containing protein n=1 Tax=Paraflavitalea speifideaquila TaxID=3076558 RepID=UPI0028E42345|nr:molybdopterin cofactor-binding domain-containing protein [Paraflavitalea speifideiaquila]
MVETEFAVPYLAHAPMEPLNCTVKIDENGCELWVGNQSPSLYQSIVATLLGLKEEQVIIHTPFIEGALAEKPLLMQTGL